jgi:hypothetical protein
MNHFNIDKFINTSTINSFKDVLLILKQLVELLENKQLYIKQNIDFTEHAQNKVTILDDKLFLKEYQLLIATLAQNVTTSDLMRIVKTINNSNEPKIDREKRDTMKSDEILTMMRQKNKELSHEIEILTANDNKKETTLIELENERSKTFNFQQRFEDFNRELAETEDYLLKFNEFVETKLNSNLKKVNLNNTNDNYDSDDDFLKSDNDNLGERINNFDKSFQNHNKIKNLFSNWSSFVEKQIDNQREYESSSLLNELDIDETLRKNWNYN